MVSVGTRVAHQLFGAEGGNSGLTVLSQGSDGDIGITAAGQPDCSIVHQPLGGDSLSPAHRSGKKSVAVVSLQGPSVDSSTHSRGGQSDSGLGVQRAEGSLGLEIISSSVSDNQCNLGSPRGGPVCISPILPIEPLLQLETGSTGRGNECLSTGLGPSEGLCEPPMVPNWEGPEPSEDSTGSGDTGSSHLEGTTLVPSSPGNVMGLPSTTPSTTRPVSDDIINGGTGLPTPTSRMAYLRGKFASQSLSRAAGDLLLSSWRTKSNKTYDSHFKKWVCWCTERGSDPISGPVSDVANFLADLHGEGYQSSSLNVFRSAISSVHDKVDGVEVGKHPIISRLLKGAFHLRPPLPRYSSTWSVDVVLQYLKGLGPTATLSLKSLTHKLVMLLALTRPSRSADLASLNLDRRRFSPEGVAFLPSRLAKQSRQGRPLVEYFFPSFPHDPDLCPVRTLRQYELITSPLRGSSNRALFLAMVKPHLPVASCTIARWLKKVLEDAGIDVSIFSAHSVRGASSSAAALAGVTTNVILEAADWSTESVFRRFYYKPRHSTTYGDAVLSASRQ